MTLVFVFGLAALIFWLVWFWSISLERLALSLGGGD